ncbi:MAG: hypothetical protein EOO38_23360 [Cytophagaceae bacterium]|nr:MAG: hypothetical protein EOO38_23360 [Cytophagaceae bacterium]
MARSNTRFRLPAVLAEAGGSFVYVRRLGVGIGRFSRSPILHEEIAWLERPEVPGYFCFDSTHSLNNGWWEFRIAISDADSAFEFKMRFA